MRKTGLIISIFLLCLSVAAQPDEKDNYVGLLPSILAEPYDTLDAIEVNTIPLNYEHRFPGFALQIRPMVNYRIHETSKGISQIGGTIICNRYLNGIAANIEWLIPKIGVYASYNYNRLDKINTLIFGLEPGVMFILSSNISLTAALQPGIDYFPDAYSREFVGTTSGFKGHFGVIVHAGFNF